MHSPAPLPSYCVYAPEVLLDFLARELALSRRKAKALLDERRVFVNGRRVWMAQHALKRNDVVEVQEAPVDDGRGAPQALYEDEALLVVNKPAGRLSVGSGSLEEQWRRHTGNQGLCAVHRLDRDTTGCLILARNQQAFNAMVELFEKRAVHKTYHALVMGRVSPSLREIHAPVEGLEAFTRVQVISANAQASHVELKPETGRTHQLRLHLKHVGHPILGDKQHYSRQSEQFREVPRQMLHASHIFFHRPLTGLAVSVKAPAPADFRHWLRLLRLR